MQQPRPNKSFAQSLRIRMMLLTLAATAVMGFFLIHSEYTRYQKNSALMRSEFLAKQKETLQQEVNDVTQYIAFKKSKTRVRLRKDIKERVHSTHAVATHLYNEYNGKISRSALEKLIIETIRPTRYNNGRGYFFIGDFDGNEKLFAERPSLEGTNLLDWKSTDGIYVIRHMIRICRESEEGFLEYQWTKPQTSGSKHPKIAFVKRFAPFNWFIGTGEYLEDVDKDTQNEVISRLNTILFGSTGYVFANHVNGTMLARGYQPHLRGKELQSSEETGSGEPAKVLAQINKVAATTDGGFVEYSWLHPQTNQPARKLSYVTTIPEWNWIVGAGVYLDEIENAISDLQKDLRSEIRTRLTILFFVFLFMLLLAAITASYVSDRLGSHFNAFTDFFHKASTQTAAIDVSQLHFSEFIQLGRAANTMLSERAMALKGLQNAKEDLKQRVIRKTAELQQKNEELREREEILRITFNSSGDGIIVVDPNAKIIHYNTRFVRMWDVESAMENNSAREVAKHAMQQVVNPDEFARRILEINETNIASIDEIRLKDGKIYERQSFPLQGNNELQGRLWTFRDVTEPRKSADKIRHLHLLLTSIIDSMPMLLVAVDRDGIITNWNNTATQIMGVSEDKAIGRHYKDVSPMLQARENDINKAKETNEPQISHKVFFKDDDDERLFFDVAIYPLKSEAMEGAVIQINNVTDRTRMEEVMVQTEKMMSIGGLAAGMAHELNNPLGVILQSTQNISRRMSEELPANTKVANSLGITLESMNQYMHERRIDQYIAAISEAGNRAANIIRNMLDFSRRSSDAKDKVDIHSLIDNAIAFAQQDYDLKKDYNFKDITIEKDFAADLPSANVTHQEVEQVFLNLFKNAGQAMAEKQFTTGEKATISIKTSHQYGFIQIEIEDNGPGLSDKIKNRIFEPFFTTKAAGKGTGLGLSVSYFIITRNHEGKFSVESEPGKWTRFSISLPAE